MSKFIFKSATFLDPQMGWKMFDEEKRVEIQKDLSITCD